jgi:C1A family cysteine protease
MSTRHIKRFGWVRDSLDRRDLLYAPPKFARLPKVFDVSNCMPDVYDQGQLGSCTANAVGALHHYEQIRQEPRKAFTPSRLFLYYNTRVLLGTPTEDSGGTLRDAIKTLAKDGVCSEVEWPYEIRRFRDRPVDELYTRAADHQAIQYASVPQSRLMLKNCLYESYPIAFGFTVYESFMSPCVAKMGVVPMPKKSEAPTGGHAVVLVGWDDERQAYKVRNSWGTQWGRRGYFWLPYKYVESPDLAADFWNVRMVEVDGK